MAHLRDDLLRLATSKDSTLASLDKDMVEAADHALAIVSQKLCQLPRSDAARMVLGLTQWSTRPGVARRYNRGDIVYVQFGPLTFGHELNFAHPAVVVNAPNNKWAMIVPGSSAAHGMGREFEFDCDTSDGFRVATALYLNQVQVVSTHRIIRQEPGKASTRVMAAIDDFLKTTYILGWGRDSTELERVKQENERLRSALEECRGALSRTEVAVDKSNG